MARHYERAAPDLDDPEDIPAERRYGYLHLKLSAEARRRGFALWDDDEDIYLSQGGKIVHRFPGWMPLDQILRAVPRFHEAKTPPNQNPGAFRPRSDNYPFTDSA